ncbi:MAG TPA: carboxypeptidase regulatory-like domain-containing protein [Candidatus Acidoferrales bacterium]
MKMTRCLLASLVVLIFCAPSFGQAVVNSRLTGAVTDSSGASIAGAQVMLTETSTGLVRHAQTDTDGSYTFPDLPTGDYQIDVKKEGFSAYVQRKIVLEVGSNPTLNVVLQVGAVNQEVTVSGSAAMVETHSNIIGQVVNQQEVVDLPLNGRDAMQLLTLTPGAQVNNIGQFNNLLSFPSQYTVAFVGTNPGAGTYVLDGGNSGDIQELSAFPLPLPDALQEFKVDLTAVPAEYGMHSSATVNAITKSGTNEFHGDAFEFVRNYAFNARSFYSPFRDPLKRNQFGGVIGGPIRKDKLFFFGSYQDTIVRDQTSSSANVPTAQEMAGDFTTFASTACRPVAVPLKAPFVNDMIPSSDVIQVAKNIAALLPTSPDTACGILSFTTRVRANDNEELAKVDYHQSDKNTIFVRYFRDHFDLPPDETSPLTLNQSIQDDAYQDVTIGDTYLVSNTIVNSLHANLNRAKNVKGVADLPGIETPTQLGVGGNFYSPFPNYSAIAVSSAFSYISGSNSLVPFEDTDWQIADDVAISHGAHQIAFGGEWVRFATNSLSALTENGNFSITGATTGIGLADFVLGDVASLTLSNPIQQSNRKNYFALYAQDSWQINRKLTLNAGLRWEPYVPYHNPEGQGDFFNMTGYIAGVHSVVYPNAIPGMEYPAKPGVSSGDYSGFGNSYLGDMKHFAPRIGLSWDPRGKGREVVRAAYGIFYDFASFQLNEVMYQGPPFADAMTLQGVNLTNPFANFTYNGVTGVDPFPITQTASTPFITAGSYASFNQLHIKAPMLQQWNLSFEKQLGQSWSANANYIGNHGVHNAIPGDFNPAIYIPGNCTANGNFPAPYAADPDGLKTNGACTSLTNTQQRRLLSLINPTEGQLISTGLDYTDNGASSYNGLLLSLQKRVSHNFTMTANYTWSHCIDNGEATTSVNSPAFRNDLKDEYGNCIFDRNQQFTANAVYESPIFRSRIAQTILGNWQISPIVSYLTSDWLSVTTNADSAFIGIPSTVNDVGQRPDSVPGQAVYVPHTQLPVTVANRVVTSGHLGVQWINPKAFVAPTVTPGFTGNIINNGIGPITVGPLGNVGRNTIKGPSIRGFDLALTRKFKINERNEIDARFEAFNVFNMVNYGDPSLTLNSSTFGESTSGAAAGGASFPGFSLPTDPRIMQFALKWIF